jgi:hypothetical protein
VSRRGGWDDLYASLAMHKSGFGALPCLVQFPFLFVLFIFLLYV